MLEYKNHLQWSKEHHEGDDVAYNNTTKIKKLIMHVINTHILDMPIRYIIATLMHQCCFQVSY